jgi:ribonucleoside-diphosphate reductase subunit M1
MQVLKRGNRGLEPIHFDKITERIANIAADALIGPALTAIDPVIIAQKVISNLHSGITTAEIDRIAAALADNMRVIDPEYGSLAARIAVSNNHKETDVSMATCVVKLCAETDIFAPWFIRFMADHGAAIDALVLHVRDYMFDYFGLQTLENGYLHKIIRLNKSGKGPKEIKIIVDRPQYMFMRVAIQLYAPDCYVRDNKSCVAAEVNFAAIANCYDALSRQLFTHATPTLFNSCTKMAQLMSCFLLGSVDDIDGIMDCAKDSAIISKAGGGVGIHSSMIRSSGQLIRGTNGVSNGIIPQLRIFNDVALCFNQGGGKRKGSFAIWLEPWHGDILEFLNMKLQGGAEQMKCRDLFMGLFINNIFMARLYEQDKENDIARKTGREARTVMWSLFSEDVMPAAGRLGDFYGDAFDALYLKYEAEGLAVRSLPVYAVRDAIVKAQIETGLPYICYKDHVNYKSNQSNVGTIKSSNLCAEIMEYSDHETYAVCCLASINLKMFIKTPIAGAKIDVRADYRRGLAPAEDVYDFEALEAVVRQITRNLNIVLDRNGYPVPKTRKSAEDTRAIGIGIQGLADIFMILRIPFISEAAKALDRAIIETIYYVSMDESAELAAKSGSYAYFKARPTATIKPWADSPAALGLLEPDLWAADYRRRGVPDAAASEARFAKKYEARWPELRAKIQSIGLRNSLTVALMPTGTTSQILGNIECFEPIGSNLYSRQTLAGKFILTNAYLVQHLRDLGLWSPQMAERIKSERGSVQKITEIPAEVREIYKTVWEISRKEILIRAAMRGAFVGQSQSLNMYLPEDLASSGANSNAQKAVALIQIMYAGHRIGLKTGSYYIRTNAGADPTGFCTKDNKDCKVCSS